MPTPDPARCALDGDLAEPIGDPHDPRIAVVSDPWPALFGEDQPGDRLNDAAELLEAVALWLCEKPRCHPRTINTIGLRCVAAWRVLRPDLFEGASGRLLSASLGVKPGALHAMERNFRAAFGLQQWHPKVSVVWNREAHKTSRNALTDNSKEGK